MSKNIQEWKYGNYKKFEKAEKPIDGDKDNVVLCLLTKGNKKENRSSVMVHSGSILEHDIACLQSALVTE